MVIDPTRTRATRARRRRLVAAAAFPLALWLVACGGGSGGGADTGADRANPAADAGADVAAQDSGPSRCGSAADCDDGIACTVDECGADGACAHRGDDARCSDGRFCNGVERCDVAARGCARGTPPACDDGMACTTDHCDEAENRCVAVPRDGDGDGDPDRACGGADCNDGDRSVSSLAREVCNGRDDDCDGMTDEGVQSACGNCDPTCRASAVGGMGGAMFSDAGRRGVEFDPARMGLVVRAQTRMADYLWVPNTIESTVSKWDAAASPPREIARYYVGLPAGQCPTAGDLYANGCNMPSRVAVDGFGDAYVANRGFAFQGTVTKIAADLRDCVDRNGNGMIDTSTSRTPLPYGADECVLWTAPAGPVNAVLRAMAVDRGDAMFPQGYPWTGGYNNQVWYKLNPRTGAVMESHAVSVRPYGGIVTADGRLWTGVLDSAATQSIDTTRTPAVVGPVVNFPLALRGNCRNAYGITADLRGRLWFTGWDCRDALGYDPATNAWTRVDTTPRVGGTAGRGITVDTMGRVWMAYATVGDGPSMIARWDSSAFVPGGNIPSSAVTVVPVPAGHNGPSGLGFDRLGNLWLAHHAAPSQLVRYVPATGALTSYTGPNRVYTYSDFTGSVRRTIIGTGTYTEDYDAGCANPVWGNLEWDVETPTGTSVTFSAQTAASVAALAGAPAVNVATTPPVTPPVSVQNALRTAMQTSQRHLRVVVTLRPTMDAASPVVRSFRVTWTCPYNIPGS